METQLTTKQQAQVKPPDGSRNGTVKMTPQAPPPSPFMGPPPASCEPLLTPGKAPPAVGQADPGPQTSFAIPWLRFTLLAAFFIGVFIAADIALAFIVKPIQERARLRGPPPPPPFRPTAPQNSTAQLDEDGFLLSRVPTHAQLASVLVNSPKFWPLTSFCLDIHYPAASYGDGLTFAINGQARVNGRVFFQKTVLSPDAASPKPVNVTDEKRVTGYLRQFSSDKMCTLVERILSRWAHLGVIAEQATHCQELIKQERIRKFEEELEEKKKKMAEGWGPSLDTPTNTTATPTTTRTNSTSLTTPTPITPTNSTNLSTPIPPTSPPPTSCGRFWDGITCWPSMPGGTIRVDSCASYYYSFSVKSKAKIGCNLDGTLTRDFKRTYRDCLRMPDLARVNKARSVYRFESTELGPMEFTILPGSDGLTKTEARHARELLEETLTETPQQIEDKVNRIVDSLWWHQRLARYLILCGYSLSLVALSVALALLLRISMGPRHSMDNNSSIRVQLFISYLTHVAVCLFDIALMEPLYEIKWLDVYNSFSAAELVQKMLLLKGNATGGVNGTLAVLAALASSKTADGGPNYTAAYDLFYGNLTFGSWQEKVSYMNADLFNDSLAEDLLENLPSDESTLGIVACNGFEMLRQYVIMSNYSWLLMEALHMQRYLVNPTARDIMHRIKLFGWLAPIPFVFTVAGLFWAFQGTERCWRKHSEATSWIDNVHKWPITLASIMNCILFGYLLAFLRRKMFDKFHHGDVSFARSVKFFLSALKMAFILGVHHFACALLYRIIRLTGNQTTKILYIYIEMVGHAFLGILVAYVHCFSMHEVKLLMRRQMNVLFGEAFLSGCCTAVTLSSLDTKMAIRQREPGFFDTQIPTITNSNSRNSNDDTGSKEKGDRLRRATDSSLVILDGLEGPSETPPGVSMVAKSLGAMKVKPELNKIETEFELHQVVTRRSLEEGECSSESGDSSESVNGPVSWCLSSGFPFGLNIIDIEMVDEGEEEKKGEGPKWAGPKKEEPKGEGPKGEDGPSPSPSSTSGSGPSTTEKSLLLSHSLSSSEPPSPPSYQPLSSLSTSSIPLNVQALDVNGNNGSLAQRLFVQYAEKGLPKKAKPFTIPNDYFA